MDILELISMCRSSTPKQPLRLSSFLSSKLVAFFNQGSKEEILRELAELAGQAGLLKNTEAFFQTLLKREKIMSTGIGMGIAVPHGKLDEDASFFIAIGIHNCGISWDNSNNGMLVRLIFLIGGPNNAPTEYLQLLSTLTHALKGEIYHNLLNASTVEEVMKVFEEV